MHALHSLSIDDLLYKRAVIRSEVFKACDIDLVDNKYSRFARKQWLDGVE